MILYHFDRLGGDGCYTDGRRRLRRLVDRSVLLGDHGEVVEQILLSFDLVVRHRIAFPLPVLLLSPHVGNDLLSFSNNLEIHIVFKHRLTWLNRINSDYTIGAYVTGLLNEDFTWP